MSIILTVLGLWVLCGLVTFIVFTLIDAFSSVYVDPDVTAVMVIAGPFGLLLTIVSGLAGAISIGSDRAARGLRKTFRS